MLILKKKKKKLVVYFSYDDYENYDTIKYVYKKTLVKKNNQSRLHAIFFVGHAP